MTTYAQECTDSLAPALSADEIESTVQVAQKQHSFDGRQ